jgi:hypothetical protein
LPTTTVVAVPGELFAGEQQQLLCSGPALPCGMMLGNCSYHLQADDPAMLKLGSVLQPATSCGNLV